MKINVKSEIGRLKKVMVHRPGKEVERLYPEIYEDLLFDDTMDLPVAQKEHDDFVEKLKAEGIEVFYIEKLAAEALDTNSKLREEVVNEFLDQAFVINKEVRNVVANFLLTHKDNLELIKAMIAGVKKSEIKKPNFTSLEAMALLHDQYPFFLNPIPNILFERDPIINIFEDIKVNRMSKATRQREKIFYDLVLNHHPEWKGRKSIVSHELEGPVEGGDVLVLSEEVIFIGMSERTNPLGIQNLSKALLSKYKKLKRVIAVGIPKSHATMHLDTVLTQMDVDKFSIDIEMSKIPCDAYELTLKNDKLAVKHHHGIVQELIKKYLNPKAKFIVVGNGDYVDGKREQWNDGSNCLAVRPGVIVVYSRNHVTNATLEKAGVKLIKIVGSELSRGRGGPRCLTMPIEREAV